MCLLMVDIDFFKKFNDSYGHQTGGLVLWLVAKPLEVCVRQEDVTARYRGEEFSVILLNAGLAITSASEVGERIRVQVGAKKIMKRSTREDLGSITLSVGFSLPRSGEVIYLAKGSGRDQVVTEKRSFRVEPLYCLPAKAASAAPLIV